MRDDKNEYTEDGLRIVEEDEVFDNFIKLETPKADATELLAKSDKEIFALLFSAGPRNIRCIARHAESCVLDVAKAPRSLDKIGGILGITKERVRQIEKRAIVKLRKPKRLEFIEDFECMTPFEDRLLN